MLPSKKYSKTTKQVVKPMNEAVVVWIITFVSVTLISTSSPGVGHRLHAAEDEHLVERVVVGHERLIGALAGIGKQLARHLDALRPGPAGQKIGNAHPE